MQLDAMLDRCRGLEERAATLYRNWAAAARGDMASCALWTALAREEEEHAKSLADARAHREATSGWRTRLDGWAPAIDDVERALSHAERLEPGAAPEEQLGAALELEMTELDAMRQALVTATGSGSPGSVDAHADRLAEFAGRYPGAERLGVLAATLRARARLRAGI